MLSASDTCKCSCTATATFHRVSPVLMLLGSVGGGRCGSDGAGDCGCGGCGDGVAVAAAAAVVVVVRCSTRLSANSSQ